MTIIFYKWFHFIGEITNIFGVLSSGTHCTSLLNLDYSAAASCYTYTYLCYSSYII